MQAKVHSALHFTFCSVAHSASQCGTWTCPCCRYEVDTESKCGLRSVVISDINIELGWSSQLRPKLSCLTMNWDVAWMDSRMLEKISAVLQSNVSLIVVFKQDLQAKATSSTGQSHVSKQRTVIVPHCHLLKHLWLAMSGRYVDLSSGFHFWMLSQHFSRS